MSDGAVIQDLSGNGHDGIVKGGATFRTDPTTKVVSLYLTQDQWISVPDKPKLNPKEALTIEVWYKATGPHAGYIVSKDKQYGFPILVSHNIIRGFFYGTFSPAPYYSEYFNKSDFNNSGRPLYNAYTVGGNASRLYLNHELKDEDPLPGGKPSFVKPTKPADLTIGTEPDTNQAGYGYDGEIYSIRMSDTVRTCVDFQYGLCKGMTAWTMWGWEGAWFWVISDKDLSQDFSTLV